MRLRSQIGLSLVETTFAAAILAVVAALLGSALLHAREATTRAERLSRALVLAVNVLEQARLGATFAACSEEPGYRQTLVTQGFQDRPGLDEVVATVEWGEGDRQRIELRTLVYRPLAAEGG